MGRSCSICESETRQGIEEALAAGEALRDIAERYGKSKSSLGRHRDHIDIASVAAQEETGAVAVEEVEPLQEDEPSPRPAWTMRELFERRPRKVEPRCTICALDAYYRDPVEAALTAGKDPKAVKEEFDYYFKNSSLWVDPALHQAEHMPGAIIIKVLAEVEDRFSEIERTFRRFSEESARETQRLSAQLHHLRQGREKLGQERNGLEVRRRELEERLSGLRAEEVKGLTAGEDPSGIRGAMETALDETRSIKEKLEGLAGRPEALAEEIRRLTRDFNDAADRPVEWLAKQAKALTRERDTAAAQAREIREGIRVDLKNGGRFNDIKSVEGWAWQLRRQEAEAQAEEDQGNGLTWLLEQVETLKGAGTTA